jgi:hypothetical protein
LLWGVALCAFLGGPIAAAQANDNTLRATLNKYAPRINREEAAINSGLNQYKRLGKYTPLARALKHEIADLGILRFHLRKEKASTRKGRQAKRDIVNGLGLIITGYRALRQAVLAARGGPVSPSVIPVLRRGKHGEKLFIKGYKLLSTG